MKIVLTVVADEVGGAERYLELLADELADRGVEVAFVGRAPFVPPGQVRDVAVGPKWSRRTLFTSVLRARRDRSRLLRAVLAEKPDLVHLQFKREQVLLSKPLARRGVPVIWTEHGVWPGGVFGRGLGFIYRRASRHVRSIICVSRPVAASLREDVGVRGGLLHVIDNPVDPEVYFPDAQSRAETLEGLGIGSESVVVVTTSRLETAKGIDRAIESIRHLPAPFHLLVVGDGQARHDLEVAAGGDLTGRVTFTGFRDDVAAILRACDVFLLPSTTQAREGSPLSLLQAVATGLPHVVTRDSGVADVLVDTGVRVAEPTAAGIASAVQDAHQRRADLSAMALQAAERYTTTIWADEHHEAMRFAAATPRGSA